MCERENVLSHAVRIKEISVRIEDAHKLNNGGRVDNAFKQNLERDVIQCSIRGLRPEFKMRVEAKDTFRELITDNVDIEQRLAANSALRKKFNTQKLTNQVIIKIVKLLGLI